MVMLTVTLSAVGLPLEGIAFIAAIDRIIDMMRHSNERNWRYGRIGYRSAFRKHDR